MRLVAPAQEIVNVEVGEGAIAAAQLDVPHRACRGGPAGGKERIDQRAERADGVRSRLPCASQNEDLDGAKLAHRDIQFEALVEIADGRAEIAVELLVAQSRPRAGFPPSVEKDLAIPVHCHAGIEIDFSPHPYQQLISRTQYVIGGHRNPIHGSKSCGNFIEQLPAIHEERAPGCIFGEHLEFGSSGDRANHPGRWRRRRIGRGRSFSLEPELIRGVRLVPVRTGYSLSTAAGAWEVPGGIGRHRLEETGPGPSRTRDRLRRKPC
jgi:hypothetical protein